MQDPNRPTTEETRPMRRIHIGLDVQDLDASIRFYSQLFGQEP